MSQSPGQRAAKWGRLWRDAGRAFAGRCANALLAEDTAYALRMARYYRAACGREDVAWSALDADED
jgi:hypothetical protein